MVTRDEVKYREVRTVWNAAITNDPGAFAICEGTHDVQQGVRIARKCGIPVCVHGRGYDWSGRSVCDEGIALDLSKMRQVEVDPHSAIATVAGGASNGDVLVAADTYGLVAVTGSIGDTGFAGLILGGGYGSLIAKYGLAADNQLGAEIVLADGQIVTADASTNPDLFWALRGGGGSFGIVTSMRVQLHRLASI